MQNRIGVTALQEPERLHETLAALTREIDTHKDDLLLGIVFVADSRNRRVDTDADVDHPFRIDAEILDKRAAPILGHDEDLRHVMRHSLLVSVGSLRER